MERPRIWGLGSTLTTSLLQAGKVLFRGWEERTTARGSEEFIDDGGR